MLYSCPLYLVACYLSASSCDSSSVIYICLLSYLCVSHCINLPLFICHILCLLLYTFVSYQLRYIRLFSSVAYFCLPLYAFVSHCMHLSPVSFRIYLCLVICCIFLSPIVCICLLSAVLYFCLMSSVVYIFLPLYKFVSCQLSYIFVSCHLLHIFVSHCMHLSTVGCLIFLPHVICRIHFSPIV